MSDHKLTPLDLDAIEARAKAAAGLDALRGAGIVVREDVPALVARVRELERLVDPLGHGKRVCNVCESECAGPVIENVVVKKDGGFGSGGVTCSSCAYDRAEEEREKFKSALEEIEGKGSAKFRASTLAKIAREALGRKRGEK